MSTYSKGSQPPTSRNPKPETGNRKRKSLGQCFLEDRNILALEAKLAECGGKTVLEIGAGDGRLTEAILQQNPGRLIAIELDENFVALLRKKFEGVPLVEIVQADFLELEPVPADVIMGNIPYYISSDIIFRLKDYQFGKAVLLVQKEFAEKMGASPGDRNYGRLSVTAQIAFEICIERTVLRHLFRPVPKVDSAIIILAPTGKSISQFEENIIRYIFQHKKKTVRNALLDSKMFGKEEIDRIGPFARRRGVTLSKDECLEIARLLGKA